jgi:hypothetical protein
MPGEFLHFYNCERSEPPPNLLAERQTELRTLSHNLLPSDRRIYGRQTEGTKDFFRGVSLVAPDTLSRSANILLLPPNYYHGKFDYIYKSTGVTLTTSRTGRILTLF